MSSEQFTFQGNLIYYIIGTAFLLYNYRAVFNLLRFLALSLFNIAMFFVKVLTGITQFTGSTATKINAFMQTPKTKPPVFISYSRKDIKFTNELKEHLAVYERRGLIKAWDDSQIKAGMAWKREIKHALESAKIAILLVSRPYLASDFIVNNELPPLLRSAEEQGTIIIPLVLSHCSYDVSELEGFQTSNNLSKPLDELSPSKRNLEYLKVLNQVKNLLEENVYN